MRCSYIEEVLLIWRMEALFLEMHQCLHRILINDREIILYLFDRAKANLNVVAF